jgi:hypothetical protein
MSVGSQYDRKLLCDCNTSWEILPLLLPVCLSVCLPLCLCTSIHSVTDVSRPWINYWASKFFFLTSVFKTRLWISWWSINVWFEHIYQSQIVPVFHPELRRDGTYEDAPCLYADESSDCWIGQQQLHYRLTVRDTPHLETTEHHHISGVSHVLRLRHAVNSRMCGTIYLVVTNT